MRLASKGWLFGVAFVGFTGCSSAAPPDSPSPSHSLTTTYGSTVAEAEALSNGDLRSTLTDSSGHTLAMLSWSKEKGGQVEMAGYVAPVDFGARTPTEPALNNEVRQLWMTSNRDTLAQGCTESNCCYTCQVGSVPSVGGDPICTCCYCRGIAPICTCL